MKTTKNMKTWDEARDNLCLGTEDEIQIEFEEQLIETVIKLREEKGLTQKELAQMCNCKQSAIARFEMMSHSPQVDSLLKILVPLGYKLEIVPITK